MGYKNLVNNIRFGNARPLTLLAQFTQKEEFEVAIRLVFVAMKLKIGCREEKMGFGFKLEHI